MHATFRPSPYLVLARGAQNHVHPLGGEKVHWTFSSFHLAPGGEKDYLFEMASDPHKSRKSLFLLRKVRLIMII
ncbi:MAG: hypothetical protein A3E57_07935 [Candidatus Muproteobacteria bacterium RIFCSPHIGHO2_12_FULL_60_33]|uniref:Uncharacterized protein n=1 Tax=Candidatus Muproteobacteria bacterium RIFCSPLOWO2_01_FULL_60_18 TaxID=1817768 RepID=A0A1F6TYN0_9PROT|nr:MAG: hypothetical protein A3A87_07765 [Candidatus Muproteobacteria bacterium RIFCSPLOWO2_01_FULL_60_18]OGI53151.1 MAG: hypothetical protein A2W42_08740 [Candidatus Muproteobacteria bacterium RIFCSPHIGHO2_01_60_12]OGI56594.1 MAG: hypothetical protein A3E57_07935 [Candidatus Muproteobacteria bacterium RIFCSPHIGHO2_12_FULL_60_33]OGI59418.1 MAG: hypothetical protein A2809_03760 [Candidatus Muproteobacteria bacterium RIFCSPHIGHO2_01_FULL_61_200]